mgnify:CR=1 FL=1
MKMLEAMKMVASATGHTGDQRCVRQLALGKTTHVAICGRLRACIAAQMQLNGPYARDDKAGWLLCAGTNLCWQRRPIG